VPEVVVRGEITVDGDVALWDPATREGQLNIVAFQQQCDIALNLGDDVCLVTETEAGSVRIKFVMVIKETVFPLEALTPLAALSYVELRIPIIETRVEGQLGLTVEAGLQVTLDQAGDADDADDGGGDGSSGGATGGDGSGGGGGSGGGASDGGRTSATGPALDAESQGLNLTSGLLRNPTVFYSVVGAAAVVVLLFTACTARYVYVRRQRRLRRERLRRLREQERQRRRNRRHPGRSEGSSLSDMEAGVAGAKGGRRSKSDAGTFDDTMSVVSVVSMDARMLTSPAPTAQANDAAHRSAKPVPVTPLANPSQLRSKRFLFASAAARLRAVLQGDHSPEMSERLSLHLAGRHPEEIGDMVDDRTDPPRLLVDRTQLAQVRTVVLSVVKKPLEPAPQANLERSLGDFAQLAELKAQVFRLSSTAYDSSNAEHEAMLERLWQTLKPGRKREGGRVSEAWKEIGFQGTDPATDFRGGGFLSLLSAVHLAEHHTDYCGRHIAVFNIPGNELLYWPLAITSINVTGWVVDLLARGELDLVLYARGCTLEAINEVHVALFRRFALTWEREKPKTIMEFGHIQKMTIQEVRDMGMPKLMAMDEDGDEGGRRV